MIRDLSQTLAALLSQPNLPAELATTQIVFDRPTQTFNPTQTVIDLFLYDIRENLELRSSEPEINRINGQATILSPPMRVDCTYLITAWPVSGSEIALKEHRLLSQVLQVLSRYNTIPEAFLRGSLTGQKPSLPLKISSVDGLKNPAEFWAALGIPLRAAIAVTITISLSTLEPPETYKLVRETSSSLELDRFLVDGEIKDINHQPVANATVQLVELSNTTTSKSDGHYSFSPIPAGIYTLRVQPPSGAAQNFPITVPPLGNGKYQIKVSLE
jgi:hypothetical protein